MFLSDVGVLFTGATRELPREALTPPRAERARTAAARRKFAALDAVHHYMFCAQHQFYPDEEIVLCRMPFDMPACASPPRCSAPAFFTAAYEVQGRWRRRCFSPRDVLMDQT